MSYRIYQRINWRVGFHLLYTLDKEVQTFYPVNTLNHSGLIWLKLIKARNLLIHMQMQMQRLFLQQAIITTATNNLIKHQAAWGQHSYPRSSSIEIFSKPTSLQAPRMVSFPLNRFLWHPPPQKRTTCFVFNPRRLAEKDNLGQSVIVHLHNVP